MKVVLLVLLLLGAGAGAWYSGLSEVFMGKGLNQGQYQDFKQMIAYRQELDKEIVKWTALRNDMIKRRGQAADENASLLADKASMTRQRDEQLSTEAELKETEAQLNSDLSKVNKQIDELTTKLGEFALTTVQEVQAKLEAQEAANTKLQEEINQIQSAVEVATKKRTEQQNELTARQTEQAEYRAALAKNADTYTIKSVDNRWNFVVINAGEGSSIDPTQTLLVTRNGRSIGKLKVSSMDKTQTVADIITDSVPAGMSIQPGDVVQLLRARQSAK